MIQKTMANHMLLFDRNCQKLLTVRYGHPLLTEVEHTIAFLLVMTVTPSTTAEVGTPIVSLQPSATLVVLEQYRLNCAS